MNIENLKLQLLTQEDLHSINGGGLVEDVGYACHWVADKACEAAEWVEEKWNDLKNWWNS